MLLDSLEFDAMELRLRDRDLSYRWEFAFRPERSSRFTVLDDALEDTAAPGHYPSVAVMRFTVEKGTAGQLLLKSLQGSRFNRRNVEFYEGIAQTVGLAMASRQAQWALRERVKELTCLYGIGRIAQLPGVSLGDALQRIVELLPPAWQFSDIACARIILDGRVCATPGFREGLHCQTAELTVNGKVRGCMEVAYVEERVEFAEGPFLAEERSLIDTVAREVGLIVERRETEESQANLQAQLRHADRLATIGQLAAGVAHELNEPLGSILGFAQLMQKGPDLPKEAAKDLERIVKASLHAREVIHKLLVFSRQKPPVKVRVNLNRIVEDGLYFLESRCARAGITLCPVLAPDVPEIPADASQLHQVVVNLVVNSIQAMPDGGTLTIETRAGTGWVSLSVQDTGAGMTDEVKGAFTGAAETRAGFFQTADGGTIFLDEISATSPSMQVRLLRVLQEHEVCMVGSTRSRPVDIRVVAATNKDLPSLIQKEIFREDLYFRLNVITIELPPLRDRAEDVLLLIRHFAGRFAAELGKPVPSFSDRALQILRRYRWPGNVRELENVVQRLVVMADGDSVDVPDLPSLMRFSALAKGGFDRPLAEVESEYIRNVLASVNGNRTRAAEILGIDRKTLREKLKDKQ